MITPNVKLSLDSIKANICKKKTEQIQNKHGYDRVTQHELHYTQQDDITQT